MCNVQQLQTVKPPGVDRRMAADRHLDYNAELVGRKRVHDELVIFRVRPDAGMPEFQAGQFTTRCSRPPCGCSKWNGN